MIKYILKDKLRTNHAKMRDGMNINPWAVSHLSAIFK